MVASIRPFHAVAVNVTGAPDIGPLLTLRLHPGAHVRALRTLRGRTN